MLKLLMKYHKRTKSFLTQILFNNWQSELLDQKSILFDLKQKLESTNHKIYDLDVQLLQIPLQEKR